MTDPRRFAGSRRLSEILQLAPGLAEFHARMQRSRQASEAIAPMCREISPGFDPRMPGNVVVHGNRVRLRAKNAPQATKLRQSVPRIVKILQASGFEGIEIELVVQPDSTPYPDPKVTADDHHNGAGHLAEGPSRQSATPAQMQALLSFSEKLANTSKGTDLGQAAARLRASVEQALARTRERD